MRLKGKKAVVTGGNRNIGQAIAWAFASEGADIFFNYYSDEKGASATIAGIEKFGCRAQAVQADFSKPNEVEVFFKKALDFLGSVDLLVNNAGDYDTSSFFDLEVEKFNRLLQVGVVAPMALTQLVARQMQQRSIIGSVINISSISGLRPSPNRIAHSTAKAALIMLTKNMALELAEHKIRVNCIAPGAVPDITSDAEYLVEGIPLGRAGDPEDIARMALFLASGDSSWVMGQVVAVDGGHTLSC